MDPHTCERERIDATTDKRSLDSGRDTGGGDDHSEMASVTALEGHTEKIRYVVCDPP